MNAYAHHPDDDQPHKTCPWPDRCNCTHQGCTGGWIDVRDDEGNDRAIPCSNCRPEVAEHLRKGSSITRQRANLHSIDRPSRTGGSQ